jgi:chlorophyllide a reductase subunit X
VGDAPPVRPKTLTQDELLALFSNAVTGADYVLTPASDEDMRGKYAKPKVSLEVVYDDV